TANQWTAVFISSFGVDDWKTDKTQANPTAARPRRGYGDSAPLGLIWSCSFRLPDRLAPQLPCRAPVPSPQPPFAHELEQEQQYDGADGGADQSAQQPVFGNAEQVIQEAAQQGPDHAEDEVAHQAEVVSLHD